MFFDELEAIEKAEAKSDRHLARERRRLIPIDSCSQLDTGYTGRPDTDMLRQDAQWKAERDKAIARLERKKSTPPTPEVPRG